MPLKLKGVMQSPVTPLKDDFSPDLATFEKLLDFHVRTGATSMFSALSGVAPVLVRRLYDICRKERYFEAREAQEQVAALRQIVKRAGFAGLKSALRAMGRDCGDPRPPHDVLREVDHGALADLLHGQPALSTEPRGW